MKSKTPSIYFFETAQGPMLVKAETLGIARHHVMSRLLIDCRKATTLDMADLAERAGGIVIDDATKPVNVLEIGKAA